MTAARDLARALYALWAACDLSYLLHSSQQELRDEYEASDARPFVVACSRRWGKTFWCCVLAVECALRGGRVIYAYPKQKQAKRIVRTELKKVLKDCPEEMRPTFRAADLQWIFPSGGQIDLAGCDNGNAETLRGEGCQLAILDEAGFIDDLEYVYRDIVKPQLLTTGGDVIMPSTPSRSPAHPFVAKFMLEAEQSGQLVKRTLFDAPHIPYERKMKFIEEDGGMDSNTVRREYLVQPVVDSERAVVPEFTREAEHLVVELPDEDFVDRYTVVDVGFNDLTVWGFWEWRFKNARAYLVDELIYRNTGAAAMAPEVRAKERELWGVERVQRFADCDLMVLNDLSEEHGLDIAAVRKDDAEAAINALRLACAEHRLAIHPRCTTTIAQMKAAIWNKSRSSFERSGDFGHFDAVDMCKYAVRHIDRSRNPYPRIRPGVGAGTHHIPPDIHQGTDTSRTLAEAIRGFR